jgi:WD40 repeat protein
MIKGLILLVAFLSSYTIFAQTSSVKEEIEIGLLLKQPQQMRQEEEEKLVKLTPIKTTLLLSRPYRVAISPDSEYLTLSTKEGNLLIYDLESVRLILNKEVSRTPLYALNSHPKDNEIVFGDRDGLIGIFDLNQKELKKTIYELQSPISDIEYSSDGTVIGVAHFEGTVTFYSPETKELLLEVKPHQKSIYSLSMDRNFSYLATASRDKTVKIFSLDKKRVELTLKDHKSILLTCTFSDDGFLASGAADGQVIVYKREGGYLERRPYFRWICGNWVTSIKFFDNLLFAASKDGKVRIFDYKNKMLSKVIDTGSPIINIDINQNYLCVASPDELKIYDAGNILRY